MGMLSKLAGFLDTRDKTSSILSPHSPGLKVHERTKGLGHTSLLIKSQNFRTTTGHLRKPEGKRCKSYFIRQGIPLLPQEVAFSRKAKWVPISSRDITKSNFLTEYSSGTFVKTVPTGFLAPTSYEASSPLQSASSRPSPPTLQGGKPSTSCLTMATRTQQGKHTLGGYHHMSLTSLGSTAGSSCVPLIFLTI